MTIESFPYGDTVRVEVVFTDESDDTALDTDDTNAAVTIYNAETLQKLVDAAAATNNGVGIYFYDWTTPDRIAATYVAEFAGVFSGKTHIKRVKFKAKFVT